MIVVGGRHRGWAIAAGSILIGLALPDLFYVVQNHPPLARYLPLLVLLFAAGAALLAWGFRTPARAPSRRAPSPALTWLALVVGSILLVDAAFTGLILSLVGSPVSAIEGVLLPLVLSLLLLGFGIYSALVYPRRLREDAISELGLRPTVPGEPARSPIPPPPPDLDPRREGARLERAALEQARGAYEVASPFLRRMVWGQLLVALTTLLVEGILLYQLIRSPGIGFSGLGNTIQTALFIVLPPLIFVELGLGFRRRLADLDVMRAALLAGGVPNDRMFRTPYAYLRSLSRAPGEDRSPPATGDEGSHLERALELVVFGQRMVRWARRGYSSVAILVIIGAIAVAGSSPFWAAAAGIAAPQQAGTVAEVGWLAASLVLLGAFVLVARKYRPLDEQARRLAVLEVAESQLEQAFWSRY